MAQIEHDERKVVTIPPKTISVAQSTGDFSHFKKMFLTILEAKYLISKGKEVLREEFVCRDGSERVNYFVYVNFDWLEDHLPTLR